jgi:hypothetical protein
LKAGEPAWWLLAAAVLVALVQTLRLLSNQAKTRARVAAHHARAARAVEGEAEAVPLLEDAGYAVVDRQVAGAWAVVANGETVTFGLRADLLVSKDGRRYIAEVKTGKLAPRLDHAPTRRQILEYRAAFDVDGVILVDADSGAITHVEVPLGTSTNVEASSTSWIAVMVALALGALVGFFAHRAF